MNYKNTKNNYVIFSLSLVAGSMSVFFSLQYSSWAQGESPSIASAAHEIIEVPQPPSTSASPEQVHQIFHAQAKQLQERLQRRDLLVPPLAILSQALSERQGLLQNTVTVHYQTQSELLDPWVVRLAEHPSWLALHTSLLSARFEIDAQTIEQELMQNPPPMLPPGSDAEAANVREDGKILRATITGMVKKGFAFDARDAAQRIALALHDRDDSIDVSVRDEGGRMTLVLPDGSRKKLGLLASGKSNFAHSPEARAWNIHKALYERINGVIIPAQKPLAFNDTLDVPITLKKGWKEALGLFGGGAAMTPGGGICQAATTTYRAALSAGLPILKRKGHSLYVSYYEKYGVGMDATIFPGQQDLIFKNDSNNELLLHAYTEGDDAFVDVYGVADGRHVALTGPYFSSTKPRDALLRPLAINEIGWIQRVTHSDGRIQEKALIATYQKGIPRKVKAEFVTAQKMEFVHAAAPHETAIIDAPTASVMN